MRKSGNVSIKKLNAAAETTTTTNEDGTTSTTTVIPSGLGDSSTTTADVETVITTMINNDKILDEDDVNGLIDNKLTDYTTTIDLQSDYTTKTLLTNSLDNYTSKELLTQSLSDRPTFTTTDAITSTTTNHESRIKALEDNFVSTTSLTETLATKANSTHTHTLSQITDYTAPDLSPLATTSAMNTALTTKANSSHTHTISDITDYTETDLSGVEEDINELTEQVLEIESVLSGKANSTHTHTISDINMPYEYYDHIDEQTIKHTGARPLSEIVEYNYIPDSSANALKLLENLESTNTIVGSNVLADNETRLAAAESALSGKAASSHTHVISDITDLTTTLSGKAASSHTHAISDITDLTTTLSGKAASTHTHNEYAQASHTHTLSDITDYTANDLTNCAKLNTDNTFTAAQTIITNVNFNYNQAQLNLLNPNAGNAEGAGIIFGKDTSNGNYGGLLWVNNTTNPDLRSVNLVIPGGNGLTLYKNYPADIGDLNVSGTLNVEQNATFKGTLAVNVGSHDAWQDGLNIKNSSMVAGDGICFNLGKNGVANNNFYMRFVYAGDDNVGNKVECGFSGYGNLYRYYRDHASFSVPLTTSGKCTAYEFESNSTSNAAGHFWNSNGNKYICLGQSWSNGNAVFLTYRHVGDNNVYNNFTIGFLNYSDLYVFYRDFASFAKPLTVDGKCTATEFSSGSDRRLKENIEELSEEESITLIDNIKVYSFNLKNDNEEPKRIHYGVIAQELQEIAPELVYTDIGKEHYLSVNYTELIPHLINKIHQQDKQIKDLTDKMNQLFELLGVKE